MRQDTSYHTIRRFLPPSGGGCKVGANCCDEHNNNQIHFSTMSARTQESDIRKDLDSCVDLIVSEYNMRIKSKVATDYEG